MGPHTGRCLLRGVTSIVSKRPGKRTCLIPSLLTALAKIRAALSEAQSSLLRGAQPLYRGWKIQILEPLGYREELGSPPSLLGSPPSLLGSPPSPPGSCRWNPQCCIAELSAPRLMSFPVIFPGKRCTCHSLGRKCLLPHPSTVQKMKVILALKYCIPLQSCTLFMLS